MCDNVCIQVSCSYNLVWTFNYLFLTSWVDLSLESLYTYRTVSHGLSDPLLISSARPFMFLVLVFVNLKSFFCLCAVD